MPDTLGRLQELFELHGDGEASARLERASVDFVLFELGEAAFALRAHQVEEVIAWRPPVPLPRADSRTMGIIQDRGRIIVILSSPAGAADVEPSRILVCRTPRGYLGLPAGRTRCVNSVKLYGELVPKNVVDTSEGVVTFLDTSQLVAAPAKSSA